MEDRKIVIKSGCNGRVNLYDPYNRLDMTWDKKNSKRTIQLNKLKEAIWTEGVSNLFIDGYLIIDEKDSLDIMKELGLEEPGAETNENIIILTDVQRKRLMTTAPLAEFKETFKSLNYEQRQLLAEFAIENKLIDYDKCEVVKQAVGTDIIKAISLRSQIEEE